MNRIQTLLVIALSIIIPGTVVLLYYGSGKFDFGEWVYLLPSVNAVLNSVTVVLLILARVAIKRGNRILHERLMLTAISLGFLFLISYITYHAAVESTIFGDLNKNGSLESDELASIGGMRLVYVIVLLSHILLAAIVVPLVLFALVFALTERIEKHKKVVRFAWPVWFYVSTTGVIVYFMISPYY